MNMNLERHEKHEMDERRPFFRRRENGLEA